MTPLPRRLRTFCLVGLLIAGAITTIDAHPVSITRTSVYVTRQHAAARIEILLEDLYLFHQLQPNREDVLEREVLRRGIALHEQFLRERFEIADVEGRRYEPTSIAVVSADLPEDGVPLAELMSHQLTFELRFDFPVRPDVLMFAQRFTDEAAVLPSEMHLRVTQESAGAPFEHTLLPHEPYSLRINWDNPPLSPEASAREQADWLARERDSLLGITNYGSVYSFLYIEDNEVRHEILAPVMTLAEDLSLPGDDDGVLDVNEQHAARTPIANYFADGNPVTINGKARQPVVQRCEFHGLDMTDFARPSQPRPVPLANARVGIILSYPIESAPTQLQMTWNRFSDRVLGVTAVVIAGNEITRTKLSRLGNRNVLNWKRTEAVRERQPPQSIAVEWTKRPAPAGPWLSFVMGLAGAVTALAALVRQSSIAGKSAAALLASAVVMWSATGWQQPALPASHATLSESQCRQVFRQLHTNTYRAFEYRTEDSIYDALAHGVEGDLLREIYLEIRRGLATEEQGGASARIDAVEIVEMQPAEDVADVPSFGIRCRWNVTGTIEHWGHLHRRTNQYAAHFVVSPISGFWKLAAMDVFHEQHLEAQTTVLAISEPGSD